MNHLKKIVLACWLLSGIVNAQDVKIITKDSSSVSIRGLSVADDEVIWVSGSEGTIGKSTNGGETWQWMKVTGFDKTDFRDIEAFNAWSAIIMGVDAPAYILNTADGGKNWKVVFTDTAKGMFLDAMEFWNEESGIVIGDPINGKFFIARTFDGGKSWRGIPAKNYPVADSGEACFAASGTNIRKLNQGEACFVTGGSISRLFIRDQQMVIPFPQGKETCGANSVAVKNDSTLIVVGGDFTAKDLITNNCFITKDAGKTWTIPVTPPHGYRSCIEYLGNHKWVCCGLNGVDYSTDDGKTWQWISKDGFNVCRKAKNGGKIFFAGNNGKIGELIF